jgi:hypothetical protein
MGHHVLALMVLATIFAVGCANAAPPDTAKPKPAAVKQAAANAAASTATGGAPTPATAAVTPPAEHKPETSLYYIDFRLAQNGLVGHTYIAHGRLGGNGRPASAQYVDYHPEGGFGGYVAGFVTPMTPVMQPAKETLAAKVLDSYRLTLTAKDYRKLTKLLAEIRASRRPWTAFGYNCNDLLADAARALGLSAPMTNAPPSQFLPTLRAMNGSVTSPSRIGRAPATGTTGSQSAAVY